jgi:hypothetical protein
MTGKAAEGAVERAWAERKGRGRQQRVETIARDGKVLCCIVRSEPLPLKTEFPTPSNLNQQLGFIVYPKGGVVRRHAHRPVQRVINGTAEVLIVRAGECELDVYDDRKELVGTWVLKQGDIALLSECGHAFRMLEDTIMIEVKQGPYAGVDEKEFF